MKKRRVRMIAGMILCLSILAALRPIRGLCPGVCGEAAPSDAWGHPSVVVSDGITFFKVDTIQNPSYRLTNQLEEWDDLKTTLKEQIVPQAVTELLAMFPDTFGYLSGSSIGIGLNMFETDYSSELAAVQMRTAHTPGTPAVVELSYSLRVNVASLSFDEVNTGALTEASRRNLESTIAHEMLHGLMMEVLTAGMAGVDVNMQAGAAFPKWFVEGTAQTVGGGTGYVKLALKLSADSTEEEIRSVLGGEHRLGSGTNYSNYCTGYLATLYLGHLMGGGSMEEADVAAGLDQLLNEIRGGKSLNQAIADNTAYEGIADFEASFAGDGAAFAKEFLEASGSGMGGLISGDYQDTDLLEDTPVDQPLFLLNTEYEEVWNQYPEGYTVISGGQAYLPGAAGPEYSDGFSDPDPELIAGDVNGDGRITIADAVLIQWVLLNPEGCGAEQKDAADVNGDGRVTGEDVAELCRAIVGLSG